MKDKDSSLTLRMTFIYLNHGDRSAGLCQFQIKSSFIKFKMESKNYYIILTQCQNKYIIYIDTESEYKMFIFSIYPYTVVTKENQVLDAVKAANVALTAEETMELEKVADSLKLNVIRFWEKEMK